MHISLISIGNCPSLALRNVKQYCLAHADVRDSGVRFDIYDYDVSEFRQARIQSAQQWSYVTKFDQALAELTEDKPDVAVFSCYLWNIQLSLHLAHLIKLASPDTLTVFGGPDAGPRAIELLRRYTQVDFVVEGDGEIPFVGLVREWLSGGPDYSRVPSLRYRNGTEMISNPAATEQVDLSLLRGVHDVVPTPEDMSRWPWPNLLYETLRGCPYACSYCMYGKTKMNEKDLGLVVEELAGLLEQGFVVEIIDPTFTTYRKRAKQILRELGRRQYAGRLHFEAYPDSIDQEMAELMVGARVSTVGIGFQTLSGEGLKAVKRPKNLARFERAVSLLDAFNIYYYVDIIYGLPNTNVEDFLATVDYLYSRGVNRLMIYRLLGLPGSPMMADKDKYRLVFSGSPPYELLSSGTYSLQDLIFCDRFRHAYERLLGLFNSAELELLAEAAGGVSKMVVGLLEFGVDRGDAFKQQVENESGAPGSRHQTLRQNLSASSPASRSNHYRAAPKSPSP